MDIDSGEGELEDATTMRAEQSSEQSGMASEQSGTLAGELKGLDSGAVSSRRGAASLRERNLEATLSATFPSYPESLPVEEPFALPPGFVDQDAPVSARKW